MFMAHSHLYIWWKVTKTFQQESQVQLPLPAGISLPLGLYNSPTSILSL